MSVFISNSNQEMINTIMDYIDSEKIFISILGWEDGHYFPELCEEDGGAPQGHIEFFKNLPVGKKLKHGRRELAAIINSINNMPYLHSLNNKQVFHYDLHIWTPKIYIIYNAHFLKIVVKNRGLFNRLFSPVLKPKWEQI